MLLSHADGIQKAKRRIEKEDEKRKETFHFHPPIHFPFFV
jgi:hypothetical protein